MENKRTGADDSQGGTGITDLTKGKGGANEVPFELGDLGTPKLDSLEAIKAAEDAKINCPISKLLKTEITMTAELIPALVH